MSERELNRVEVLTRAEFVVETGRGRTVCRCFLTDVAGVMEPVDLAFLWRPQLKDPKDEMVLETAVNGQADAIVTFNTRDFSSAIKFFGLELLPPKQALERIKS